MKNEANEIVIYESSDGAVKLPIRVDYGEETVWLTRFQIADLFERDVSVITKHLNNVFKEELSKESNVHFLHIANSDKPVAFYSLDVIISVGYRVKSKRGIEFRKWANAVLKNYILKGYAVNNGRVKELGQVIRIMKRVEQSLDAKQVLSVVEKYNAALDMLDDYDHQRLERPKGNETAYVLTYEECRKVIDQMKFASQSPFFGNEKDDSFKGCIGNIYQSFGGRDLYPSIEEKAANLLYLVTKDHGFSDGNKRIAATLFLYFLDKNGILFADGEKLIDDHTLVALTILIAESKPEEKEMMVTVVMNCLCA